MVSDHCQYRGKFLGWAEYQRNLTKKSINFTAVIAHYMALYDIPHICAKIVKSNSKKKFYVIPTTDEKKTFFSHFPSR